MFTPTTDFLAKVARASLTLLNISNADGLTLSVLLSRNTTRLRICGVLSYLELSLTH